MSLYLVIANGRLAYATPNYQEVVPYGLSQQYAVYEIEASPVSFDAIAEEPDSEVPDSEAEIESGE